MGALKTQAGVTANMLLQAYSYPLYKVREILRREPGANDKYILFGINSFLNSPFDALAFGCMFAICSRGIPSKFKYQVTAKQLAPIWITTLALETIFTEIGARTKAPFKLEMHVALNPEKADQERKFILASMNLSH